MKKPSKIKLQVKGEVVRALQTKELRDVEGGNLRQSGNSADVCCA